ncbi:hypothetical protein D3870_21185 [Noviherbaspirillum cavernae]|uniref:Uncharacterized protein n=1 Tax=Noviherbaspirillum cavernae TaxID=2320862 RepID=A0A418WWI2_9BURK|nr:hypothetical protein [Noviherbaspirillum cavernae]RJF96891.1 hypothetical protein D3870_21185 [Noviherbaspirillum cavernae]
MNAAGGQIGFGGRRAKREVIDVPEPKVQDQSLDKLLKVRKQRIDRLERERREMREAWRKSRADLNGRKQGWRDAVQAYKDFWQEARENFYRMSTTSGQFRKAKAIYERMKGDAAQLRLECLEDVARCRKGRTKFFEAKQRVLQAHRQQEKLGMLRDELRKLTTLNEM